MIPCSSKSAIYIARAYFARSAAAQRPMIAYRPCVMGRIAKIWEKAPKCRWIEGITDQYPQSIDTYVGTRDCGTEIA
jgi:hypothetical protein